MDRWLLLAWFGLIRFGMEVFEKAIKDLSTIKLRNILQRYTNTWRKATLTGIITTAVLNSSTLLSLLTLWFVSTGMMSLFSALGILVWANIWSTFMWLIVWFLWFWDFSISSFALPLVALWGGIMIVTNNKYRWYRSKLFLWFWLFFLWIFFLKENVDALSSIVDFNSYQNLNLRIFGIIWLIITMLVQSSWAITVMTLTALSAWLLQFEAWYAIVLWSALGTTSTALIASLSGTRSKKQLSIWNLIFNAISVWLGILFFKEFIWITLDILGFHTNPAIGIAVINAVFSTFTSLIFVPILPRFTRLVQCIVPLKNEHYPLRILANPLSREEQRYSKDIANIALDALHHDKLYITKLIGEYTANLRWINYRLIQSNAKKEDILHHTISVDSEKQQSFYYTVIEQLDEIFSYINKLNQFDLEWDDRSMLHHLQEDFVMLSNACQSAENKKEHITIMRHSADKNLIKVKKDILHYVIRLEKLIYYTWNKKEKYQKSLKKLLADVYDYRDTILTKVSPYMKSWDLWELDISSLVNLTRELADQCRDIIHVLQSKKD